MPGHSDDTTLLAGLIAGRAEAFAAVYDRFAGRLLAAAWGMLGNRADAEDAVQDVFAGLVRSRASLAKVEDLTAYVFASLRHAAARRRRRPGPRALGDLPAGAPDGSPSGRAETRERAAQLESALRCLPVEQCEVIALKIDGGLTFAEIAAVLRMNPNTVAGRYRRAIETLRRRLKE